METNTLGKTGLTVSRLGLGLSDLGDRISSAGDDYVEILLNSALDSGINFLDTAACYGKSEELIGRTIASRRDEYILSTKAGHIAGEVKGKDWTASTVLASIDQSLQRMNTDHLDIVHLHSCGVSLLEQGDLIHALQDAKQAGKTRFIGYSGDNEAAEWAVDSGLFDTLQTSYNLVDQKARRRLLPTAEQNEMGVIIKRPIANAAWGKSSPPSVYAREYHRRATIMLEDGPLPEALEDAIALALGFVLAQAEVDTAIVGTNKPEHLRSNMETFEEKLPISPSLVEELKKRFDRCDKDWDQRQ